ncbi:hypothetical protein BSQ40_23375 [Serratia fonticola]|nr:hypothetical protein BSQ40_23375 [Serratia fonticola]
MVTLTNKKTLVVLLRFMMLITKVNVNIKKVRSRSKITRYGSFAFYDRIAAEPFTSVTSSYSLLPESNDGSNRYGISEGCGETGQCVAHDGLPRAQ